MKIPSFSVFVRHFCPPGSGSGSTDLTESGLNPDQIRIRNTGAYLPGFEILLTFTEIQQIQKFRQTTHKEEDQAKRVPSI